MHFKIGFSTCIERIVGPVRSRTLSWNILRYHSRLIGRGEDNVDLSAVKGHRVEKVS